MEELIFNKYQSSLEELQIDSYPQEIQDQFFDFINNVPFIKHLISPVRTKAKYLPRDASGKIVVDLTKPHILEDMDYFRPSAIHFQKYGCYTKLRPNPNPNSEYGKWIREEIRRCYDGYVRESDGEWITGDMYFFLNYCPIQLTKKDPRNPNKTIRVVDFPKVWEGHYYVFHYLNEARNQGKHAAELASRGKGKAHPYDAKVLTSNGWKLWKDINIGDYLWGDDGNLTKVIDIPFNDVCPMYKITLADGRIIECSEGHLWDVYSHYHKGELKTFSTKYLYETYKSNRKVSYKNPKGIEYQYSIKSNKGVDYKYKNTKVDPYTFGLLLGDGCFRINGTNKTHFTCHDDDWKIIKENIPYKNTFDYNNTKFGHNLNISDFIEILKDYGLHMCKSEDKFIPDEYLYNSRKVRLELLKGLIDSDGTTSNGRYDIDIASKKMRDQLVELCLSLGYNYRISERNTGYNKNGKYIECKKSYRLRIYTNDILCKLPRKIKGISSRSNSNYANSKIKGIKIVNIEYIGEKLGKCVTVDNKSHCYLIGDYITTHNSYLGASLLAKRFILGESAVVNKKVQCVVTASERKYIQGANQILDMFQYYIDFCTQNTEFPSSKLTSSIQNMQWTAGYVDLNTNTRRGTENAVTGITSKDDESKLRGSRGVLYLLEEMGTFPRLLRLYSVLRPSVEDGNDVWGTIFAYGTAGDSESDFAGAQELMYNPQGYNMLPIPNVFDKEGQGRKYFTMFFGGYLNRAECYNDDGVSNVTKALVEILLDRYKVKYNSTDINAITKRIAEIPITPQEAILRTKGNIFPVTDLNARLNQIDNNPQEYNDVYVGNLVIRGETVDFVPTTELPIRDFPLKDNKAEGNIEIFKMPEKNSESKVFPNRYLVGHDPVDDDSADTMSLSSTFVLDTWTDQLVAEYTGRKQLADENYEIVRKLCLFYNAKCLYESNKKGIFAYFQRMHCLHLLADTPEYLKDKDLIKSIGQNNKSKGVNATAGINNYANTLIRDWLLKPVPTVEIVDGQEVETEMFNLYKIRNRALIKELILYNPDINVDRIRALGMLMLYREEKMIMYQGDMKKSNVGVASDYLGNDPFFSNNYDNKFRFN